MFLVADVGGTNTRVAWSDDGRSIKQTKRFNTPKDFQQGAEKIVKAAQSLNNGKTAAQVVIGIPGTIDKRRGKTIKVPNLPEWSNKNVSRVFESKLKQEVKLANDAELAALGEAVKGAGKGFDLVAYLTVSTGIGGALVSGKKLVPRAYNSEPGHMVLDLKSRFTDGSGRRGTLEALASGPGFEEQFGIKAKDCADPKIWEKHAEILGEGIINLFLVWSPEILVIGGGLSQKGNLMFKPLREYVESHLKLFPSPKIEAAALGDDSGIYGGLIFLK